MEGNMVNLNIDNSSSSMASTEALKLIEDYFKIHLPEFNIEQKYNKPEGYYGIKFSYQGTIVFIGSGRGFLEAYINLDGEEMPIWKLDKKISQIESLNENNIKYILHSINKFFS